MMSEASFRSETRASIIGANGMLGTAWIRELDAQGINAVALDLPEFDILEENHLRRHITDEIDLVVNCSGYTDVDGAESNADAAMALNGTAVRTLAKHCVKIGATLVHYSTDYVFDGTSRDPYSISAPASPLSVYGQSKLEGEQQCLRSGVELLLIRTSWLYAPWGRNFVRTLLRLAKEQDEIRVVDDQTGCPTSAQYLAKRSLHLFDSGCRGLLHVTDGGSCSWYDFACEIVRLSGTDCRVTPCATSDFPRPAPRPPYSVLDTNSSDRRLGEGPGWKSNLAAVLSQIEVNV